MVVFAAVIFLLASFQMTTKALTVAAGESLSYAPEILIQKMKAGRQESIPVNYMEKLTGIFGIRSITPRVWGYYFHEISGANFTILGLDPSAMPLGDQLSRAIDSGNSPGTHETVVGEGARSALAGSGSSLFSLFRPDLTLKSFTIVGTFKPETDLLTYDSLFMPLGDARDLFALSDDMVTDLCVTVANPKEVSTIAKKIASLLPDTRVVTREQVQKTYQAVFGWRSGFASICLLTALTSFIIFAWDKASGLTPEEKKEISVLKIVGWQTSDILTLRFWEAVIVSLVAFLVGYTLAYVHVAFFDATLFRPIMLGWSVLHPALRLIPSVDLSEFILVLCLTVVPYLAATVIPAWRSAIIRADSALN
ncbi:MAG: FtsX-like permease family protein [Proteobacteria bacterium]|nr:FtsX-like permease family protein [Desulfobulbaceae bacterium]MBU4151466.1 FtsX-like permease family protein [Pseudomonadota bacterium]MDP2107025.1 FtsX-like permease family protein [Desulfobulbaceae bacterium]